MVYLSGLYDRRGNTKYWHYDDRYGVVVVGLGEPYDQTEELEDVEGSQSFQDQKGENTLHRYVYLVGTVSHPSQTLFLLTEPCLVVEFPVRDSLIQTRQLDKFVLFIIPDVDQLLATYDP